MRGLLFQWLRRFLRFPRHAPHRRAGRQLRFDTLEDRCLLSTLTVLNLQDNGAGSLRQAILSAASGDTINFQAGLSGTIVLTSGELAVNKDLTISGLGADQLAISGNNASRVFHVFPATVSISGLTITESAAGNGAGLFLDGNATSLTLIDCVFTDNHASFQGGALQAMGPSQAGPLILSDCTFSNNTAGNNGGAIDSPGVALTIQNTTFSGNSSGAGGGALSIGSGTVSIVNSTISGNSAATFGGGINSNFSATFNLTNVTIDGNSAGMRGGGISSVAPFNLANTIVANNSAPAGPDVFGLVISQDYNLIQDTSGASDTGTTTHNVTGQDPLLGPLADN